MIWILISEKMLIIYTKVNFEGIRSIEQEQTTVLYSHKKNISNKMFRFLIFQEFAV